MSMMLQRAAVLGVLVITGSSWAQRQVADPNQGNGAIVDQAPDARGLSPRVIFEKLSAAEIKVPPSPTGKLIVKFTDDTKARANSGRIESIMARDVSNAQRIIQQYGLVAAPAIRLEPNQFLSLESRAATYSGKAQPDLGGMIELAAPGNNMVVLEQAARELNELAEVEFVSFQVRFKNAFGGLGACCVNTTSCIETDSTGCLLAGGVYLGAGTSCATPGICSVGSTTGRCCIPANGIVTCLDSVTAANCIGQGGDYGSNGSTCAGLPSGCPQLGACCLPNDQCQALIEAQCIAGQFRGVGTNCLAPGICEQVGEIGRCCVPSKGIVNCIDAIDAESCEEFGGVYGGDGSDCNDISFNCPNIGACCTGGTECQPLTQAQCDPIPDSTFLGIGTNCADEDACEDPDCGIVGTGPCLSCHDPAVFTGSGGLFCEDEECCEMVCEIDPFCCEEDAEVYPPGRIGPPHWDDNCVLLAFTECGGFAGGNVCLVGGGGPCDSTHLDPGCDRFPCCTAVCVFEPSCCEVEWDQLCVDFANANCVFKSPVQATPSLTDAQGYLTALTYEQQFGGPPPHAVDNGFNPNSVQLCDATQTVLGYNGLGWDLQGLWQFGHSLAQQQGPGSVNRARGKGIKVGVVEHSAFVDWQNPAFTHEDLRGKVIAEPGQTIIINPFNPLGDFGGHHGTACLGIIGAKDDNTKGHAISTLGFRDGNGVLHEGDEIGVVGIAPEADLYFFPDISLEQGDRFLSAMGSALNIFGPGDVLSISLGLELGAPGTTLASDLGTWTIFSLARDLGVTVCLAAGNECANIDGLAQFQGQDSGVIIVGAVTPGLPYCRLGFSNYCTDCQDSDIIHVSAWGSNVATLGYGDMYRGADPANASGRWVRSYTNTFNGTSAATPQIAGLVACMQGFAKQQFGIPLTPGQIRGILMFDGFLQCDVLPADLLGHADNPCLGDYDPDNDDARIGGPLNESAYPIPMICAERVISANIGDGSGNVNDICILRGNLVFGNDSSIRQPENNALVVSSQYTVRGDLPNGANCAEFASQVGAANYLGNGEVFDVLIKATNPTAGANIINIQTRTGFPGVNSIQIVELYDWTRNRWSIVGSAVLDGAAGACGASGAGIYECFGFNAQRAGRFIRTADNRILCRVYVIGLTGNADLGGFGTGAYNGRLDWVDIQTSVGGGGFTPTGGVQ